MRRKARALALQTLYEVDCVGHEPTSTLARLMEDNPLSGEAATFAQGLVNGVLDNRAKLDAIIQTYASNFPVAQLSVIDRNILRLAIFELFTSGKGLAKVVINEAVELAKAFGSESSPRFINGVLGAVSSAAPQAEFRTEAILDCNPGSNYGE